MERQIDVNHLREYWYPTLGFERALVVGDECFEEIVDYAEIEILPTGIKKLEEVLERYNTDKHIYTSDEWTELNNSNSDYYEHIVAYVHFNNNTEIFNKLFLEVISINNYNVLDVDLMLTPKEKELIINAGLESLRNGRETGMVTEV